MPGKELHPSQQAMIDAIELEWARVAVDVGHQVDHLPAEARNAVIMQNVLRLVMEHCFQKSLPYSTLLPTDMAIRLASYAISVLPMDAQVQGLKTLLTMLPEVHERRLAKGIMIKSTWDMGGPG